MKVKFMPQNVELEIRPGQSVLDLAHQNDIHIQSVCKGIPSCAECRVYVKEGEHNVMPPQSKELDLIGTAYFVDQRRLSCQLRCFGDITIDLTEQNEKQNKSTKNPQGRYVKEREDSHARMGNLLEELTDDEMVFTKEELEAHSAQKTKLDSGSFYKNVEPSKDRNQQNQNRKQNDQRHSKGNDNNRRPHPNQKNQQGGQQQGGGQRNNNPNAQKAQGGNNPNAQNNGNNPNGQSANAKRNRNRRRKKKVNNPNNAGGGSAPTSGTPS